MRGSHGRDKRMRWLTPCCAEVFSDNWLRWILTRRAVPVGAPAFMRGKQRFRVAVEGRAVSAGFSRGISVGGVAAPDRLRFSIAPKNTGNPQDARPGPLSLDSAKCS